MYSVGELLHGPVSYACISAWTSIIMYFCEMCISTCTCNWKYYNIIMEKKKLEFHWSFCLVQTTHSGHPASKNGRLRIPSRKTALKNTISLSLLPIRKAHETNNTIINVLTILASTTYVTRAHRTGYMEGCSTRWLVLVRWATRWCPLDFEDASSFVWSTVECNV